MNKKVAVLLAEGFEEIEALSIVDTLRRANIVCDTVSISDYEVKSTHGVTIISDKTINEVDKDSYDMIVLPGGMSGADNLNNSSEVINWIKDFNNKNKYIAAICAAPQVLATSGVVNGKNVTSYPGDYFKDKLKESNYKEDLVVVDNNIITSRGPATALAFSYKLVDALGGNSSSLKQGMLYNDLVK